MTNLPLTPLRSHDTDSVSVDDGRKISPVMMLAGAVLAVLAMAAIVYAPRMWGIDPFGSDTDPAAAIAQPQSGH